MQSNYNGTAYFMLFEGSQLVGLNHCINNDYGDNIGGYCDEDDDDHWSVMGNRNDICNGGD